jgi:Type II intron maturase
MLARDVITNTKFNFKYIRYLDTFILGINGVKSEVNEIRDILESFLKSELQLNNVHSNIVDIHNDNLKFMNINISSGLYYNNKYKILFLYPKELIIKALTNSGIINSNNIPICKKNLLKYNINIIINTYIDINTFILSSFSICHDFARLKRFLSYFINCSLKLTLQTKLENKYWSRIVAPLTPLIKDSKTYSINNS